MPEYLATGELKNRYEDMKASLGVPWMGVVTMAYAHYPTFFGVFWDRAKPLVRTSAFREQCRELRRFTEDAATRLQPPRLAHRVTAIGYADRELEQIRGMLEIFSHGNFPYLLLATMVRMLLEGAEMSGSQSAVPNDRPPSRSAAVPLVLMEEHHADAPTRAVYEDLKTTLRLPFVNTDYRALARWPSYFSLAWADLKAQVQSPAYEPLCASVHERAVSAVTELLPNSGRFSQAELLAAAARDASLEEVTGVSRLFQWLLPGLVTNVAFLRAQLAGEAA